MGNKKLKLLYIKAHSYFKKQAILNTQSAKFIDSLSAPFALNQASKNNRSVILLRICQAMIAIICIQSLKFAGAPEIPYESLVYFDFFKLENISFNIVHWQVINLFFHLVLFFSVLFFLKRSRITLAKYILLSAFCSYIFVACLLWQYNLNLQYYFLLSMFVSCYIFDKKEQRSLMIAIFSQIGLFIYLHHTLPSLNTVNSLMYATGAHEYLQYIAQINTYVFAISCVICALFIRNILAQNWQNLGRYEATQSALLKKLFPTQLMPSLLMAQSKQLDNQSENVTNDAMQTTQQMGVVFLDICQFTHLSKSEKNTDVSWRAIYHLFGQFDLSISRLDAKRIKTNGDQYILLVGLNNQITGNISTAEQTIMACKLLLLTSNLQVKIGAAFGLVTCGIFDTNNPNFDIWGETVIRAARLETVAKPNNILVDHYLHSLTKDKTDYEPPCQHHLKGLGEQLAYNVSSTK